MRVIVRARKGRPVWTSTALFAQDTQTPLPMLLARIDQVKEKVGIIYWLATVDKLRKTTKKSIVHHRNGAMEQSQSVVPLTQIAAPSHLGLIMPSLHHGMPTTSVAHARDTVQPGRDTVRLHRPWGIYWARRHPQSLAAGRFDGHWRCRCSLLERDACRAQTSCAPFWNRPKASTMSS